MTKKLRLLLYAQVLFFAVWATWCMTNFTGAPCVWLDTNPVDPRDLMSGKYVSLSYPLSDLSALNCPSGAQPLYLRLRRDTTAETTAGTVSVFRADACALSPEKDGLWARTKSLRGRNRAEFGIERFYLNEDDPLLQARSGQVLAQVSLGRDHSLRIIALAAKKQP